MLIPIEISKSGAPCIWEQGGATLNKGEAVIVANKDGDKPIALHIRRKGELSNSQHALIPVEKGFFYITAKRDANELAVRIFTVEEINGKEAVVKLRALYANRQWIGEEPRGDLIKAVNAAKKKAQTFHCKSAHYVKPS